MKLLNINEQEAEIVFSLGELTLLNSMIGEVCYGFYIPDFEIKIGMTKEKVSEVFNIINNHFKKLKETSKIEEGTTAFLDTEIETQKVTISISLNQLTLLEPVFNEVFRQIDDWEFQTRTGFTKEEAISVLDEIKEIIAKFFEK